MRRLLRTCLGARSACLAVALAALGIFAPIASAQTPAGTVHSVTITWAAPAPVGGSGTIVKFRVYRSTVTAAGTPGPYVQIGAPPFPSLGYVDTTIVNGQQYNYCVSTVDSASGESVCSTPVLVAVPVNPNAPSTTASAWGGG